VVIRQCALQVALDPARREVNRNKSASACSRLHVYSAANQRTPSSSCGTSTMEEATA
jgi:hypothetical protein